jgi:tetratricopeptide (TPR) repeat protein
MGDGAESKGQGTGRRFAAFMSYAHADAAMASKLQSRLERYRLPKHLAQSHTGGQAALGQVFRDREDLAAAPSLSDAIRDAISQAEALVVICSPDAKASRWVGEEIALFRALHPDRPVLAAVVRGAPDDAFPAALTAGGNEPLAADLRKEADGPSLGFLKIVAGIAGVPLDALVQRDAQRRIRRVMWITGSAIAAMLIMGVMTTLALSARNEAARQRAEAEGLVEYMLTDLRDKLEGVGKIDIMEGVNHRAMGYYSAQGDLSALPPDGLLQRARIIEAMGRDDENRGDFDAARRKYLELDRVAAALLANDPANPDRIFAHAQSQNRLALLAFSRKNLTEALPGFEKAEKRLAPILLAHRVKDEWLRLGAYVNGNLCAVNLKLGQAPKEALQRCRIAVGYNERLIAKHPERTELLYDLVFQLTWLDEALLANGNPQGALEATQRSLSLIEEMKRIEPKNMLWREQEMQVHANLADKFLIAGNRNQYRLHRSIAEQVNVQLVATDPNNALWKHYAKRLSSN